MKETKFRRGKHEATFIKLQLLQLQPKGFTQAKQVEDCSQRVLQSIFNTKMDSICFAGFFSAFNLQSGE